jgi:ABC-type transport system involved in multi-copper enzyme maturation permease subunit
VSPLTETRLVAARELQRSIRSAKGIALGVLTLIGAVVASFLSVWIEGGYRARATAETAAAFIELKRQALTVMSGDPQFADHYAASVPISLFIFLKITVWLSPLLVALLGFDSISGDLQHRTIRFWTVRARRSSLFIGKGLALWLLVGIVAFALNLVSGTVALARGYVTFTDLVAWGTRFWFVVFVIAGAWAAIATLVSSCFRAPIVALLTTLATFFVLWLAGIGAFGSRLCGSTDGAMPTSMPPLMGAPMAASPLTRMAWYEFFYPNAYDALLLSPEWGRVVSGVGILLAFVVVVTVAGCALLQRRDV